MQGTRGRVLQLVIAGRGVRVEALANQLGITPAAVRRHLDNLRADGLVSARAVKQATGRPYYVYYPTDKATGDLPAPYADLLERMLRSLAQQGVDEDVVRSIAESLASRHRAEVSDAEAAPPEVRVRLVTESLRAEGILDSWRADEDGFHLVNVVCPYLRAAEISPLPCESDRRAIEMLLGADVEQLERIVDGAPCCEYLVPLEAVTTK